MEVLFWYLILNAMDLGIVEIKDELFVVIVVL